MKAVDIHVWDVLTTSHLVPRVATAIGSGLGFVRVVYMQSFVLQSSRWCFIMGKVIGILTRHAVNGCFFIVYVCTSMHRCVCLRVHVFEFQVGSQQR